MNRTVFWVLSVAAGAGYLWQPHIVLKGLSVALLSALAWRQRLQLLALALALSSLGDVLLALGRGYFRVGLTAFLAAHLVYIALFVRKGVTPGRRLVPAILLAYGVAMAAWLSPSLGLLRAPVFAYIAAIIIMVASAYRASYRDRRVFAGAVLFLISDSLLAASRFKGSFPYGGLLIWTTYYAGQCLIAWGVMGSRAAARTART